MAHLIRRLRHFQSHAAMPQPPSPPDDVIRIFVSYARKDMRWFDDDYKYHLIP